MTDELKTLEDLKIHRGYNLKGNPEWHIYSKELKAEAVKWVKEKYNLKYIGEGRFNGDIGWIHFMEFFNITEEDLE